MATITKLSVSGNPDTERNGDYIYDSTTNKWWNGVVNNIYTYFIEYRDDEGKWYLYSIDNEFAYNTFQASSNPEDIIGTHIWTTANEDEFINLTINGNTSEPENEKVTLSITVSNTNNIHDKDAATSPVAFSNSLLNILNLDRSYQINENVTNAPTSSWYGIDARKDKEYWFSAIKRIDK